MNNQRKVGAVLSYVSIILTTLITLVYTPFMIHKIGQSEYGLYSIVASVINYLTLLDLGFGNAIVVYTAKYRAQKKYDEEKKLHGMFFVIFSVISVITLIIGLILYFNVTNLFGSKMTPQELDKAKIMMLILTFNLFITFIFSIYSSIITAYEKFVFQKILAIIRQLLNPILMIPLLIIGYKSIAMVIVITVLNIFVLLTNWWYCRKKLDIKIEFSGFDKILFKTIFVYSFYIFLNIIVDKVNWALDNIILGATSGTIAVAIYAVAAQLNTLFINLSSAVSSVMLPKVSKMIASKASDEEISKEFNKVGRIQYYIIFFMVSSLVIFGKEFIVWWVGNEYIDAYCIALLLIIPVSIPLIQNLGISILQAKNMHKFRSILYVFIAIANIGISIPLAKLYSGIGAAVGTAMSLIIGNILIMNFYYQKKAKINIVDFWKQIGSITLYYLIPILLIVLLKIFIPIGGIKGVILYGIIYFAMYAFITLKFVINDYEKNILNSIINKLKKVIKR